MRLPKRVLIAIAVVFVVDVGLSQVIVRVVPLPAGYLVCLPAGWAIGGVFAWWYVRELRRAEERT